MSAPSADAFEKLASFYLGRHYDLDSRELLDDLLMYDARDLCTHAMCVGMTGSGKTGLCISLLEEAALDGIPSICLDPKGDLANLLLTFPELRAADFEPWLDPGEAVRKGIKLEALAEQKAALWRNGLADWGQSPDRIRRLKDSVDMAIYTPGSNIGIPLTVLRSMDAPSPDAMQDREIIADRITGLVSGLLALMRLDADPMTSPEHILLSSIVQHQWGEGKGVGISQLVRLIQKPPLERIGVVDLDSFMTASDRSKFAMRLNNVLASPAFASWLEGEPLSIKNLLYTPEGKPRLSIVSISHLNDSERMFFVTILLNELLAWVRTQTGTSSLRAMFYMDEVAGYFPPVSNPPSKPPMLTLLKQARAFGLGITLATQNPVDLDYKGLSNIGTWFLGRLQTERDKARVLDGLEGAAGQAGQFLDRAQMDRALSGLGNRVFLMNNVHDGFPSVLQTRWTMSFLAGPLARGQISQLMADRKPKLLEESSDTGPAAEEVPEKATERMPHPAVPAGIEERFLAVNRRPQDGANLIYRPALYGHGSMHFIHKTVGLDVWTDARRIVLCDKGLPTDLWLSSSPLPDDSDLIDQPDEEFSFSDIPSELLSLGRYRSYQSKFKDFLYRHHNMTLYKSPLVSGYAPPGDESDARAYFKQRLREQRDEEIEKLRDKYESRVESMDQKIRSAQERVDRERSQSRSSMISAGSSVIGVLLGGFLGGRRTKMSTAARGVGHATEQSRDVQRAESAMSTLKDERRKLEVDLDRDLQQLHQKFDLSDVDLEPIEVPPRKSDLNVTRPQILWMPWQVDSEGHERRLF